ncbi:MAG: hypothetical protein HUU60_07470 [Armatimonadetes bacterium]|nr:hypothetical protein [Armatimonadota bacterium]
MLLRNCIAVAAASILAVAAFSQTFFETEPNDDKANANAVTLGAGAFSEIRGNSTASTLAGIDTFRVKTVADARGVYRYRLILTTAGTAGHTGSIRGLTQAAVALGAWPCALGAGVASETTVAQTSSTTTTPARFVQWYGFGKEEEIYYRVTGTASTTIDYVAVFEKQAVAVTDIGRYKAGQITISTIGRTNVDTEIHVFDCDLNAIPGSSNDDESVPGGGTGATLQSILRRDYGPGKHYLAIGRFNTATHLGSPCDDDFRTGALLDFPNAVTSGSSTTSTVLAGFSVTDADGARIFAGQTHQPYEVHWYSFTVLGGGDVNGDCCVDDTDLAIVLEEFGRSGADLPADVNGDGVVDDTDLAIVLEEFGLGC